MTTPEKGPPPLKLPKEFPRCPVCGSRRLFCQEAMKGDIDMAKPAGKVPALFSFELVYSTPLFPIKLIAVGDVCVDCGTPRIVAMDKVRGQVRMPGDGRGPLIRGG